MKNLLIIYPHWPPSNLAGVHRPRLIANFLREFGWHPIVLTVSQDYYEEPPDPDMAKTVSEKVEVHYCNAFKVSRPRLIGDIGLRSFPHLLKKAREIIAERNIDFVWIPIPSYYVALLGRILHEKTGVPYGIDYIDPWVEPWSNCKTFRNFLSQCVARILEPLAVKKASLITGVSTPYYQPVLDRNFAPGSILHVGMPYGFDPTDHEIVLDGLRMPWAQIDGCRPIVYAGAFLPNARLFVEALFSAVRNLIDSQHWDPAIHLFFLGTGNYPGKKISDYAEDFNVAHIVHEERGRSPFLHILNYLTNASAVMVIGSTEKHYTASKVFQALLSKRPVFSIFHHESSAVKILQEAHADLHTVRYHSGMTSKELSAAIQRALYEMITARSNWAPTLEVLDDYSARTSAQVLAEMLGKCIHPST